MLRNLNKRINNRKGFTLIELIIVVAILGILAAVAVPSYQGYQTTAKENANKANMAVIQNAIYVYIAEEGELPDDLDDVEAALENTKYLGKVAPVPVLVGDGDGPYDAIADETFVIDASGIVTIDEPDATHFAVSGEAVE